jgi:hypothetical protein
VHSIHTRGVTVVTIVTLVFAPVFKGHHWVWHLIGRKVETKQVACQPHEPCPAEKTIVDKVYLPAPDGSTPKGDAGGPGNDHGYGVWRGTGHGHQHGSDN